MHRGGRNFRKKGDGKKNEEKAKPVERKGAGPKRASQRNSDTKTSKKGTGEFAGERDRDTWRIKNGRKKGRDEEGKKKKTRGDVGARARASETERVDRGLQGNCAGAGRQKGMKVEDSYTPGAYSCREPNTFFFRARHAGP